MKAVRYQEYGTPDVLQLVEVERPSPAAGQVLIQVAGTSFNPVDAAARAGYLQQVFPLTLPHTPGIDVAGTVAELGAGVDRFAVGDAVIGLLSITEGGATAEFVLAPAEMLAPAPKQIPLAEAAAVPVAALTAWQALFDHANLQAGQRILINGAGGGVGGFAVQLAKHAGAYVIATAGPRSIDAVRAAGADQLVDYTATPVSEAVTEPVDVVLNLVIAPDEQVTALIGLVKPGGVLVTTATEAQEDADRKVGGIRMFLRPDAGQLATITDRIDAGDLSVDISDRYSFDQIALVHEKGSAGAFRGKVLLLP